jgi:malonate-semialdehyde dehydrogenase (acetylating)/methylmalonate-semialdehyde dehydrogenase
MPIPVIVPIGRKTADAVRKRLPHEIPRLRIGISTDPNAHAPGRHLRTQEEKIGGYIQLDIRLERLKFWRP